MNKFAVTLKSGISTIVTLPAMFDFIPITIEYKGIVVRLVSVGRTTGLNIYKEI